MGRKADQWALGCVLFEIMALEPLFKTVFRVVESTVPEALATRLPSRYSPTLAATLRALLASKPDDRPNNAPLLRGELIRASFHAFLQSLEGCIVDRSQATGVTSLPGTGDSL